MKLNLLLSAAALVCLAWPFAGVAAPPSDKPEAAAVPDQPQPKGQGRKSGKKSPPTETQSGPAGRGAATATPVAPSAINRGAAGASAGRATTTVPTTETQRRTPRGDQTQTQGGVATNPTPAAPRTRTQQVRPSRVQPPMQGGQVSGSPAVAPLGDWNRAVRGADRDRAGEQWRQSHTGWDSTALWRRDSNWWRHDSAFRLYLGPRIGFFFFPGFGYIHAPTRYRNHYWRAGEYLPHWFWRYTVRDYWRYGLPRPPIGCVWVWLNGDVALIDTGDGYIIDVVRNIW